MDEEEFQALLRYQATLSRQVVQEAKTDRKIKLLGIINSLSAGKRQVQTATLLHEAESAGFSEDEAYALLDELARDNLVRQMDGYVQRP